jgi:hypothetical protein
MEYEAGDYQKLAVKQFTARSIIETAEGKYWKQFKAPVFAKQVGTRALPGSGSCGGSSSSCLITASELIHVSICSCELPQLSCMQLQLATYC